MGLPVASILGGVSYVSGLFTNPNDQKRKTEADRDFQLALNGDTGAEARLRCHAGEQAYFDAAVRAGLNAGSATTCGYATTASKQYAAGLVAQLNARRAAAGAAGAVAGGAVGVGMVTDPATFAGSAGATAIPFVLDSIPWGTLLLLGAGLYLLTRK